MKYLKHSILYFLAAVLLPACAQSQNPKNQAMIKEKKSIHEFSFEGLTGETINFEDFKGKKLLIVNTASKCGFTGQYKDLESIYKEHKDKLVVIGFPANNFGGQEPGTNNDIASFCEINYGVTFPMAAKSSVKGKDINPIMEWLIVESGGGDIMWNFEKFLVDENGQYLDRYRSMTKPSSNKIISRL